MRLLLAFLLMIACVLPRPAAAMEEIMMDEETKTIADYIDDFLTIPPEAVDWKLLGKTGEIETTTEDETGFEYVYIKPDFPDAVKALDGQTVTMKGFMFPLEGEEKQALFLIGPFPVSCPFHYHVSPALVVEVRADDKPVAFTYDAITIKGRLELIEDDPEFSTFYRLWMTEQVE